MSRERILREHFSSIYYTDYEWELLRAKRERAKELMNMFREFIPFIYGSVARGNVHKDSDIDIIFLNQIPSFQIELVLNKYGYQKYLREIIMATPNDSIRLYIHLNELECITLPITKLNKKTLDFYSFGGKIDLNKLNKGIRVPGIDKRLVLIKPNPKGHEEFSIIDNENIAAKEIGISISSINERKKVLLKREKKGRTGVYLKRELEIDETIEEVLKELTNSNATVRKKIYKK